MYPTLAGLDLSAREEVTGVDLAPVLRGDLPAESLTALSETSFIPKFNFPRTASWTDHRHYYPRSATDLIWVALREGDLVFKRRNLGDERFGAQAFDLGNDPLETRDLFDPDDPRHQDARKGLLDYKALLQLGYTEDAESGDLDVNPDDQTHLLQALGYAP